MVLETTGFFLSYLLRLRDVKTLVTVLSFKPLGENNNSKNLKTLVIHSNML
jgi:hypothetical protein